MHSFYSCLQLDKIFRVVGTPTEDFWPGVSSLPNYKPHKMCYYPPPKRLASVWPRLAEEPFAESLATSMLQQRANKRILTDASLVHRYFADLPAKIYELRDGNKKFFLDFSQAKKTSNVIHIYRGFDIQHTRRQALAGKSPDFTTKPELFDEK